MIDPGEALRRLRSELSTEEQYGPTRGLAELELRRRQREELEHQLVAIEREVRHLHLRLQRLQALPEVACISWAQNVLAYPNGRIMVVDTAAEEAGVVHVLLLNFEGGICCERLVAPACVLSEQIVRGLGLTARDLLEAPPLPHIWPALWEATMGRYILTYDLKRTSRVLESAAEQYDLDPLPIIGDCLLQRCQRYYKESGFTGLQSLCKLTGHPLPDAPDCTAFDRALGQLHLLRSMALGITTGHGMETEPAAWDN